MKEKNILTYYRLWRIEITLTCQPIVSLSTFIIKQLKRLAVELPKFQDLKKLVEIHCFRQRTLSRSLTTNLSLIRRYFSTLQVPIDCGTFYSLLYPQVKSLSLSCNILSHVLYRPSHFQKCF